MPTRRIRMPLELLLIGLAVIVAILALMPAGRRLIATAGDIVDGSVAMFAIRQTLGLDTTTARQRRIDRRRAREQAEILRRIGASDAPAGPIPAGPTRLVVSGDASSVGDPREPVSRHRFLRDGAVATVGLAIVLVTVATLADQPTGGVLGATASPRERIGVARVSAAPANAPVTEASTGPSSMASAGALDAPDPSTIPASQAPLVVRPGRLLSGRTGGGPTVAVKLSWALAPGSAPATAHEVSVRVDDDVFKRVATLDGGARSLDVTLDVGHTSTFRIRAAGPDGTVSDPVDWAPITPDRHQESSSLVTLQGAWRQAEGPSLSGGGVRFARERRAALTFRFSGTDVAWVATLTPMSGRAVVRIDGTVIDTVDLGAGSVRYRQLLLRHHVEGDSPHLLEIRPVGDGRVDVDAFVVLR